MNNIGSVFRTADAFLVKKIYLCGITATPPHKDIHKTALGATESVEWQYYENTLDVIKTLHAEGYLVLAVEQAECSYILGEFKPDKEKPVAVIFGHEIRGVQQEVVNACDGVLEVPQFGTKHSLNISVCAGIVTWELAKSFF
jgi:tRNA G18 (ribose-2'-O)-methylase SpoU